MPSAKAMVNSLARDRGSNVRQALTIMEPVRSHGGAYIYTIEATGLYLHARAKKEDSDM